ncbi:MAG: fibronectin type III domain-containing protein [Thermoleophilia bacterium]|nr:fibronectin type III domain-containing protein [Thermoleophilia bacterium]
MGRQAVRFSLLFISLFPLFTPNFISASLQPSPSPGDAYVFGADSPVAPSPYQQTHPAISGDLVFWLDNRPNASGNHVDRIFLKDLSDPEASEQQLTPGVEGNQAGYLAADGDLVVFTQASPAPTRLMYCHVGDDPQLLAPSDSSQIQPAVSGSRVVWSEGDAGNRDLYTKDLASGQAARLTDWPGEETNPAIAGDWVVFVHNDQYNLWGSPRVNDIWALDLSSGELRRLTPAADGILQQAPDISYDPLDQEYRAVYSQTSGEMGIRLYTFSSGQTRVISAKGYRPAIDGKRIVWESAFTSGQVLLHDLATGITQQVSSGSGSVYVPDISGERIAWSDSRQEPRILYTNRIGDTARELAERYAPELNFPHDIERNGRDDFEPRTVELMVDGAEKLVTGGGEIVGPTIQDLIENPGQDSYLDLPGSPANPLHSYIDKYLDQIGSDPHKYRKTAYARVVPGEAGTGKTVIQYWLNYYYNNWLNNHEGDWEMVQVILDENLEPEAAAYSQHGFAFKKNWNEFGFKKNGTHPKVYVAEGSHANYFFEASALHFLDAATGWAYMDSTGSASSTIPEVEMDGLAGGWAGFAGMWGQEKPSLCFWCFDGPVGPAFQPGDPWDQPIAWSNVTAGKGYLNDIIISLYSPVEIHLYDPQGNHVGKNSSGGIDMQIPGSEYFEREEDHSKNIVVRNTDVLAGYTLKVEGTGTGTMDLEIQIPDFGGNVADKPRYLAVEVNPAMKAELSVTPAKDFDLQIDADGDGIFEQQRLPDSVESIGVDFTPPGAVTDLSVSGVTSDSATLTWAAPGNNGNEGTAFRYDLRYASEPITEDNWPYARTAAAPAEPRPAGFPETATVTGLDAGATYYFAIRTRDGSWQEAELSNVAQTNTTIPSLTWTIQRVYWVSWDDYENRHLSIDYLMGNAGTSVALESTVQASHATPDTVYAVTALPLLVDDIDPGANRTVTLKYYVPLNVSSFTATTYAACSDDAGRTHWFPGPLP